MEEKVGQRITIEGTFPGWVYQHDQSAIQVDAQVDPRSGPMAHELGMRSSVAVQLRHREKTVGQLIVISREPDVFAQEDLETLELLSVVLSSALSHAAEFESKRQQVEALARFETIYQGAAIGIALISPEGGFLDVNPAFELMFGYTMAELGTMTMRDYTDPEDIDRNEALFREMMDGTRDTYEIEKRFLPEGRSGGVGSRRRRASARSRRASRSTRSRWSRTSRNGRKPNARSPTWRTTTS